MVNQVNNLSLTQSNLPSGGSPPLIFRPNWGLKGRKNFLGDRPSSYLRVLMTSPAPLLYLNIWIRHCSPAPPRKWPPKMVAYENNHRVVFWEEAPTHLLFGREFVDLSRIPVNKGIEGWVDKIQWFVWNCPPEPRPHFLLFAYWSGMRERSIACNF